MRARFVWMAGTLLAAGLSQPLCAEAQETRPAYTNVSTATAVVPPALSTSPVAISETAPSTSPVIGQQMLAASSATIKVLASYVERSTHKLIIESREALVSGRMIYVGPSAAAFTLGDIVSKTETDYYYLATAQGGQPVREGDLVTFERPKSIELSIPSILRMTIKEHYVFEAKLRGAVTAVMGDRAMIDKGSVQEVDKLDLYRIYDSSGHYKGLIELRGIGDFQSQGLIYHALEDRRGGGGEVRPGDTVIFVGQRKLFALGFLGSLPIEAKTYVGNRESSFGGGLLWNLTFPDGWGVEMALGLYEHFGGGSYISVDTVNNIITTSNQSVKATYFAPIWIKKNLFYPSVVSPFVAVGLSYFQAENHVTNTQVAYNVGTARVAYNYDDASKASGVAPVLGAGVEFFPARLIRPRIEVRYFGGPPVRALGPTFNSEALYFGGGILAQW